MDSVTAFLWPIVVFLLVIGPLYIVRRMEREKQDSRVMMRADALSNSENFAIVSRMPNYRLVRTLMWLGIASAILCVFAAVAGHYVLAVLGFVLLFVFQRAGTYFVNRRLREEPGLKCSRCGNLVDVATILRAPPPDRVARCTSCGESVGELESTTAVSPPLKPL